MIKTHACTYREWLREEALKSIHRSTNWVRKSELKLSLTENMAYVAWIHITGTSKKEAWCQGNMYGGANSGPRSFPITFHNHQHRDARFVRTLWSLEGWQSSATTKTQELETQCEEAKSQVDVLRSEVKMSTSSLQRLHTEMDALEEARATIEQMLNEALEESTKTEQLLEVVEQWIEQSEKSYKFFLEKKMPST